MTDRENFIKRMNEIETQILQRQKIKFFPSIKLNASKSLKEIALDLIDISYNHNTIYIEGPYKDVVQTGRARKRSCQDLFLLARYYGVNCTYLDLYHELLLLTLNNKPLGTWYCGTINQRVFWDVHKHSIYSTSPTKNKDEFGIHPFDIFAWFGDTIQCPFITNNSIPIFKIGTKFNCQIYDKFYNLYINSIKVDTQYKYYSMYMYDIKSENEKENSLFKRSYYIYDSSFMLVNKSKELQNNPVYTNPKYHKIYEPRLNRFDGFFPNIKLFFNDEWYKEKEEEDIIHFPSNPDEKWFNENWKL